MQTWAEMAKDAKARAEHTQNEIKANAPRMEVVKKLGGVSAPLDSCARSGARRGA
mgnify:CR=1 FL=1